jgi:protein SCO1/2
MIVPRRLISLLAAAIAVTALSAVARANFTPAQLAQISASPAPNAALPLALSFEDESGRNTTIRNAIGGVPAVVVFADYTCRTLCGPIVEFTADGLGKTGLRPGVDYRLVVIGINPRDGIDTALAIRAQHIARGSPVGRAAIFLSGHETEIRAATQAVGLHYAYDPQHDQYAHPAAAYIVDSVGHVRRVMSPIGLDGGDLRLALVDAGRGAIGSFADQLHLLCYGFDPAKGAYTERITTMLTVACLGTLVLMAAGIFTMILLQRRRTAT